LATLAVAQHACLDDLRPSSFTTGWSEPAPHGASADDPVNEGLFPGGPNESPAERKPERSAPALPVASAWIDLQVYLDWREGHDPAKPCPTGMVLVEGSYCVDRWEGSLVEVTASGVYPFPPTARAEDRAVRAVSRPGTMPQGYISGDEAQRACQMAGKRLCTETEWWRACAGRKKTIYPYGTVHQPHWCNEDRPLHPVLQLYGPDAGRQVWWVEPMNNPLINAQPATVAVTGARPRCKSDDGIYDMVGNLHEWTADPAGTFQGGAYSGKIALGCQYVTTAHGFSYHDYSTGFRCCTDPL
jgi:hypothetical protein